MALHRFFIDAMLHPVPQAGDEIELPLSRADLHHAVRTARLRAGERIVVVDPERTAWSCEVVSATEHGIRAFVQGTSEPAPEPDVTLFAGLTKGHKMDLTVEKCVEIGVARIVPVYCERSIVRLDPDKAAQRASRWRRVAQAAAAQSQRSFVPEVEAPVTLAEVAERIAEYAAVLVAWEQSSGISVGDAARSVSATDAVAALVGPEGGLTSDEVEQLDDAGATIVGLGSTILRSETAGIVLAALTVYELGGLGGRSRG